MMVSAFFDESGKFKDHRIISVGCVADIFGEPFRRFDREWQGLLHTNGLVALSAKHVLNARRPLSSENPAIGIRKRTNALLPFVDCIRKNIQVVSGLAVDVRSFKKLPQHFFHFFGNDPSYLAVARTMLHIAEFTSPSDKVSLIFDDDEETAWQFYRLYRRLKQKWPRARSTFRAMSFGDDRFFSGLQAADLVASIIRQEVSVDIAKTKYDYHRLYKALAAEPKKEERLWFLSIAVAKRSNLIKTAESLKEEWERFRRSGE